MTLPDGWRFIPVSNLGDIVTGTTPSTKNTDFWDGCYLFVTPSEMTEDKYVVNTPRRITALALKNSRPVPKNSVLVTCIGSIGKIAMVTEQVVTNQQINSIACNSSANPHFTYYLMLTMESTLYDHANQTTLPILNKGNFSKITIPLPPLPEQKKIATVLSKLQKAIEIQDKLIQSLRDLKKATMNHLFTHGLKGEKLKKTEIGMMPESWGIKQIGEVLKLSSGKTRPTELHKSPATDYSHPAYGGNGVMGYSEQFFTLTDTLVIGRVGEYCGAIHIAPQHSWITDNALYSQEWRDSSVGIKYLASYLGFFDLNRFKRKSSQPLVTQGIIHAISIPLPSLPEQTEIAQILQTIDKKLESHETQKAAYQSLFKTTLNKLMTGTIRVNNLDIDTSEVEAA